jgi:hypothetical protein
MFASPPFTFYIQRKGGGGQGGFEFFFKKKDSVEVELLSTRWGVQFTPFPYSCIINVVVQIIPEEWLKDVIDFEPVFVFRR